MYKAMLAMLSLVPIRTLSDRDYRYVVWMLSEAVERGGYCQPSSRQLCDRLYKAKIMAQDEEGWYFRPLRTKYRELKGKAKGREARRQRGMERMVEKRVADALRTDICPDSSGGTHDERPG